MKNTSLSNHPTAPAPNILPMNSTHVQQFPHAIYQHIRADKRLRPSRGNSRQFAVVRGNCRLKKMKKLLLTIAPEAPKSGRYEDGIAYSDFAFRQNLRA